MASRFWVGSTGSWDGSDTTHWSATSGGSSGASVPTATDTVTLDASSGGGTVTITATASFSTLTMGAFTGTLDTNSQTMNGVNFSITGTGTRTLTLGASAITLTGTATPWDATVVTNLTFNAGTSVITLNDGSNISFHGGGLNYADLVLTGGGSPIIRESNTFVNLTRTGIANKTSQLRIEAQKTQTVTGTLTCTGNSITNRVWLLAQIAGATVTISAAAVNITNTDLQDINGTGAASWDLSAATGGSGNCGGNTLKALGDAAFTTPVDQHWVSASGGNWSLNTNWTSRVPLPQDNVFFDNIFGVAQTVTSDMPRMGKSIDWTGATWVTSLTWQNTISNDIFGSLTLISGLTLSGANNLIFRSQGSETLKTFGVTMGQVLVFTMPNGTLTLQDDLTGTGIFSPVINTGTWTAGSNNVTTPGLGVTNSTIIGGAVLNMGTGTWTLTGTSPLNVTGNPTVNGQTSTMKFTDSSNTAMTVNPGGGMFNDVWFARGASTGNIAITSSGSFNNFKDTGSVAHTFLFNQNTVTTFNTWTLAGTAGNVITLDHDTGVPFKLSSPGGIISSDYLAIAHSTVIGGARWFAGKHSTDSGGNHGWRFAVAAPRQASCDVPLSL